LNRTIWPAFFNGISPSSPLRYKPEKPILRGHALLGKLKIGTTANLFAANLPLLISMLKTQQN
jgi:hypothetical protein